jgi:hypothetical protein
MAIEPLIFKLSFLSRTLHRHRAPVAVVAVVAEMAWELPRLFRANISNGLDPHGSQPRRICINIFLSRPAHFTTNSQKITK